PLVAGIGFACAMGVLLIWRRSRTRKEGVPKGKDAQGIGAYGTENHAAPTIPTENIARTAVEENEGYSDSGRVLDEPASEEVASGPVASQDSEISSEESAEAVASD